MISIYGVMEIRGVKPIGTDIVFKDDQVSTQDMLDKTLLVRGISVKFSFEVKLRHSFGLASFSYYCKDGKLQTKHRLFTSRPFEIIKRYDSDSILDSSEEQKEIFSEYYLMQEYQIRSILTAKGNNTLFDPASLKDIYELGTFLDIEFPDSYIAFLKISNGYKGYINGRFLELHGIEDMRKEEIRIGFETRPMLTVGFLGDYPIHLQYVEDKEQTITIVTWDYLEDGRLFIDNKATSFFGFLESINHR